MESRGKRIDNGEWVEGFFFKTTFGKPKSFIVVDTELGAKFIEVVPETVGQFTGRTDKIGAKIFNKDICTSKETNFNFLVNWDKEACAYLALKGEEGVPFSWFVDVHISELIKVGNIYDNHELLKQTK